MTTPMADVAFSKSARVMSPQVGSIENALEIIFPTLSSSSFSAGLIKKGAAMSAAAGRSEVFHSKQIQEIMCEKVRPTDIGSRCDQEAP